MNKKTLLISFMVCAAIVALAAAFASSYPDGLEWVAAKTGFEDRAAGPGIVNSPMPDYTMPEMGDGVASTLVAGILGTAATFLGTMFLVRIFAGRKRRCKTVEQAVN